ncbi:N-acyl-D-amino-acid deacylase family protein [Pseudofrankia inefficax]|uniref:Amidohydrolase 3 n=1 Tax=Pseudofrankia inefficax (strain DSM 45817 / CECT 9037 / DDB 130130 / EuI1c) TaxID=298654 RepID=E3IWH2_PSEI1|nr:amidohydrolase family protein [Pseudofrankia inefficax]ADP80155.1 Amidohydrolase 3 [Pseudofrankia inefficax]
MSNDLLVRGGEVIDGTGADRRRADIRVRDGRIVEIDARLRPDGEPEIDATGAVVTPGFIDTHAHTDPQVFWDPTLDPESLHGVTTMLTGNCSLSLYPVRESTRGALADLFAYIEDVPRDLFDDHVPWTWDDYAGYRDAVNAQGSGINLAPLVGHSPLRLYVMGDDAWHRAATPQESAAMADVLGAAMDAGAWGLSTSYLDVDKQGRPVPSRAADGDELDALIAAIGDTGRGLVEMVPNLLGGSADAELEDIGRRCGKYGVPVTWTGFVYLGGVTDHWLALTRRLGSEGVRMYPQLSPRTVDFRLNWDSSMMFMSMPQGWHRIIAAQGRDAKAALLTDPSWRATARAEWDAVPAAMFPHRHLHKARFIEVFGDENQPWLGRTAAELVDERGGHPSDVLADFVLANDCRPGIVAIGVANDDIDGIARTLTDPDVLLSSSDAGAHVQMLCASGDTTLLLTRHVRERHDLTLEQAIHQLTGRQADVFGFHGRGRLAPGAVADLTVFALDELDYAQDGFIADLPNGGLRLRRPAGGYRATVVRGVPVQLGGQATGALPGRVIASHGREDAR